MLAWAWALLLGSLTGAAAQQLQAGGAGWALRFDGQDDMVILDRAVPELPWTIEMWVNPFGLKDGAGLDVVTYSTTGVLLAQVSMTSGRSPLVVLYNGAQVWVPTNGNGQAQFASDEVDPTDAEGVLYHYALTMSATNITVYINGASAGIWEYTEAITGLSPHSLSPLSLGARYERMAGSWEMNDRNFGGIIDELRFWNVVLSADEVKYYMNRTVPSSTPGLLEEWRFDEGTGESVDGSYWLGGGDSLANPTWVPSPVVRHGGPVAMSARIGQSVSQDLCALLTPAVTGAEAQVSSLGAASLGTLSLASPSLSETSQGSVEGSTRFCTTVNFVAVSGGFENVPFTVTVTSPSGSFTDSQNVSLSITGNTPPSAGSANAIQVNGEDEYLSLGSWNPGDTFTISLWMEPVRYFTDTVIFSLHEADGSNLFIFGPKAGGYGLINFCRRGCSTLAVGGAGFPSQEGSELVLDMGLTADEQH